MHNHSPRIAPHGPRGRQGGFTLIELSVVILLIGIVAAITVPRLAPVIAFSQLEGSARHLAFYGRSLVAYSTMLGDRMTMRIDLDKQEYYTVRWVVPPPEETQSGLSSSTDSGDQMALLKDMMASGSLTPELMAEVALGQKMNVPGTNQQLDPEAVNQLMGDKFDQLMRRATEERAKNVKHAGFLDEIGPLFDSEFSLTAVEPVEEEITDPQLRRVGLPAEVRLESVVVGGSSNSRGLVEIELTPLGLVEDVTFYLVNEDQEYFTVTWQAASGAAGFFQGKVSAL